MSNINNQDNAKVSIKWGWGRVADVTAIRKFLPRGC